MATKKKAAAKSAKKSTPVKKASPAKKPVAKSANNGKGKSLPPKKNVKAAVKNNPVKKVAKAAVKSVKTNGSQSAPVKSSRSTAKPEVKEVKKAVAEKKPEVKKQEVKAPAAPPAKKPAAAPKPAKVVIPEIKTKTSRKYEPEFTKSVLDQPENIQSGPTMRYSDSELVEFRELIQKKLDQAKKELAYLQGLITRKDEMGGDENENRYMTMEDGSMSMEREQLAQMASRQINYIDHLEKAIIRIENKTYGICRVTGKLIDKARLRAVPHATLSIEAKQMMNK